MKATIINSNCLTALRGMDSNSVHCCVTSPPYYGLRDYGVDGQIGLENTPEEYVARMVEVFREVRRVLREDGTCWVNLGDSYWCGGNYRGLNSSNILSAKQASNRGARGLCQKLGAVGKTTNWLLKAKDLVGIPWRVAFALQADGWWLRQDIIWHKPNPMPESVTDRCTKSHEYIFLLTKSARYFYDAEAISEPAKYGDNGSSFESEYDIATKPGVGHTRRKTVARGDFNGKTNALPGREGFLAIKYWRNKRSVWTVPSSPYSEAHFATFPPDLIKPCILAGSPIGGTVLDPFGGSGTTGMVALELGRKAVLIELNPEYVKLAEYRCRVTMGLPL